MKYGHLELHIEELLKEKGISKNTANSASSDHRFR